MFSNSSKMKWKCTDCFLMNEFNSIKGYQNHMRVCTSNGNNKKLPIDKPVTSSGNSNIKYHPLECRDIIDDEEEELSSRFKSRSKQSHPHDSPCIQSNNCDDQDDNNCDDNDDGDTRKQGRKRSGGGKRSREENESGENGIKNSKSVLRK